MAEVYAPMSALLVSHIFLSVGQTTANSTKFYVTTLTSQQSTSSFVIQQLCSYLIQVPGMSHRVITPYSGFPDQEFLTALERDYQCTRNVAPGSCKRKLHNKCIQHGIVVVALA